MNYAPQIISYLSSSDEISEVFLAPNTFPLERKNGRLVKCLDVVLTNEDVRDTLIALRSYSSTPISHLGKEGSFSFSLHKVGRFRVVYVTQRGSYVISIVKTPFDIPKLEDLCENYQNVIKEVNRIFEDLTSCLVIVTGKSSIKVSTFSYSLLQYVCFNLTKVVFVLEKPLNYLLKHGISLAIQREIGIDVESLEEGLRDVVLINPDILCLGFREFFDKKEVDQIIKIMEMGTLVILNLPYVSESNILAVPDELKSFLKRIIVVEPLKERGILKIEFKEI